MGWGFYDYRPRKPQNLTKMIAKLKKERPDINPVALSGKKIAVSWWGISWNKNLERYADYESRIGRGRSYVRGGKVLDLQIAPGLITATVAGSDKEPYEIVIKISPLSDNRWKIITKVCANRVGNLSELIDGRFPEELGELFFKQDGGLFPTPQEISLSCDCPDWADMCKHIAAALYGVGARLDADPLLFFTLRSINFEELLKKSADEKVKNLLKNAESNTKRTLSDDKISGIFGDIL